MNFSTSTAMISGQHSVTAIARSKEPQPNFLFLTLVILVANVDVSCIQLFYTLADT